MNAQERAAMYAKLNPDEVEFIERLQRTNQMLRRSSVFGGNGRTQEYTSKDLLGLGLTVLVEQAKGHLETVKEICENTRFFRSTCNVLSEEKKKYLADMKGVHGLYRTNHCVSFIDGESKAHLDGKFTAAQLEAISYYMREHEPVKPNA